MSDKHMDVEPVRPKPEPEHHSTEQVGGVEGETAAEADVMAVGGGEEK